MGQRGSKRTDHEAACAVASHDSREAGRLEAGRAAVMIKLLWICGACIQRVSLSHLRGRSSAVCGHIDGP